MKKTLLFIVALMVSCLSMMAADVVTMEPDKDLTLEELKSGAFFSLVKDGKALCFPSAQNADMQDLDAAYQNDVYYFKMFSMADEANADEGLKEYYLIKVYDKDFNEAPFYGGCYLNSAGWVIFRMGLNNQYGQDGKNRAVWDVQYNEENGFSFRNINENKYMVNAGSTVDAVGYWRCVSLKEKKISVKDPDKLVIPESLQTLIDNKTVFTLKNGENYVYGPSQQNLAIGDWATASAESNNAVGYVLENNEYYYFLRAVKADGSNISAWGTNPCWLNNNGGNVVFNMGKDQDVKNGSSWLIADLGGGKYTIESVNQPGMFLAVNGINGTLSETPAEWEFYDPSATPEIPSITLNSEGYATYSAATNVAIPAEVRAYKGKVEGTDIILTQLNGYIPAGTGVLLFGEPGETISFETPAEEATAADVTGNDFVATSTEEGITSLPNDPILALDMEHSFIPYHGNELVANRAFLIYNINNGSKLRLVINDNDATAISNVVAKENRNGKMLENGKVVIVKNGAKFNVAGQLIK